MKTKAPPSWRASLSKKATYHVIKVELVSRAAKKIKASERKGARGDGQRAAGRGGWSGKAARWSYMCPLAAGLRSAWVLNGPHVCCPCQLSFFGASTHRLFSVSENRGSGLDVEDACSNVGLPRYGQTRTWRVAPDLF